MGGINGWSLDQLLVIQAAFFLRAAPVAIAWETCYIAAAAAVWMMRTRWRKKAVRLDEWMSTIHEFWRYIFPLKIYPGSTPTPSPGWSLDQLLVIQAAFFLRAAPVAIAWETCYIAAAAAVWMMRTRWRKKAVRLDEWIYIA